MRIVPLLVQLAVCIAIGYATKCHDCTLTDLDKWDFAGNCPNPATDCPSPGVYKCSITKTMNAQNQVSSYTMGCTESSQCSNTPNTVCCENDGCNSLDMGKIKQACQSEVDEAKTACSSNVNTCLAKIADAKQCNEDLHCHSCNLDTNDFDNWDFAATCAPTKCTNGKQCVITKTPGVSSATYAVGCSTDAQCNANTQMCCSTDNCNNWLNMTNVNKTLQAFQTAKATCSSSTKLPKDCVDQITEAKKAQTSGVGGLRGGLGLPLITAISVIVLVVLG